MEEQIEKHIMLLRQLKQNIQSFVEEVFANKKDAGGHPYIGHLYRVADAVANDPNSMLDEKLYVKAEIAALLHDILEDTPFTEHDIERRHVPSDIVDAVIALTRYPTESYYGFIKRCKSNDIARIVKQYDIEDNMDIRRLTKFGNYEQKRLKKYWLSWSFLKDEISEMEYLKEMTALNYV